MTTDARATPLHWAKMALDSHPASSPKAIGLLTGGEPPMLLDTIAVDPDGSIRRFAKPRIAFAFDCQGVTFNVDGHRDGDVLVMALRADLGPLPFSAESVQARHAIQDLVSQSLVMGSSHLSIGPEQMIQVKSRIDVHQPFSPIEVLTAITAFLLDLKPWLDQLAALLSKAPLRTNGQA